VQHFQEMMRDMEKARAIDPLNAWAAALHALSLANVGKLDDALTAARQSVELDHNAFTGRWAMVWVLSTLGRDDEAIAASADALAISGRNVRVLAELAAIHARRGDADAARRILAELEVRAT
jgi:tetratricopeptide (TPR) repeat protein